MNAQLIRLLFCLALAAVTCALAWLIDDGKAGWLELPRLVWLAALAFLIQWLAFIPAYLAQTEHYYDLTGSLTYACLVLIALLAGSGDGRSMLIAALVLIWCGRLGSFLFRRVRRDGKDGRFDAIKPNFGRFLVAWSIQGAWVFLTLLAALVAMTTSEPVPLDGFALTGALLWLGGFAVEAVADRQKSAFNAMPENRGRFISHGLWRWSRHPNYFGEILLWCGICIIAWPSFSGWGYLGLISPLFVAFLLIKVSGIPLLEQRADLKWAGDTAYAAYKANTPVLIPRLPRT